MPAADSRAQAAVPARYMLERQDWRGAARALARLTAARTMTLAVGGAGPQDPSVADRFEAALTRVRAACEENGIAAGLHTRSGEEAAKRMSEGFTLLTVAGDVTHLEAVARSHLVAARGER